MKTTFIVQIKKEVGWVYLNSFDTKSEAVSFVDFFSSEAVLRIKNNTSY